MNKKTEYHIFTQRFDTHEQAFVFNISRDTEKFICEINELWMITVINGTEIKTRLKIKDMCIGMGNTIGGNINDENIKTVLDMFVDILPSDVYNKHILDNVDNINNSDDKIYNMNLDELLNGVDMADKIIKSNNITQIK